MTPLRRAGILGFSLLAIALGLGWDSLRGGEPGLGPLQLGLCGIGIAGGVLGMIPAALRTPYARLLLALGALYASALVAELALAPPVVRWGLVTESQRGMVRPSRWGGFEHTPGWHGRYEDGVHPVDIAINELGDRDDPPSARDAAAAERVLLLGDSFTFGWGLEKAQTIEAQIESQAAGRAVAYNLGVSGYGPGDTLEHYRERTEFPATHTFFLMYGNDLRYDNCETAYHTVVDGVIVPRTKEDGSAYTREDVESVVGAEFAVDAQVWLTRLKSALLLSTIRGRLGRVLRQDVPLSSGPSDEYRLECALSAATRIEAMRETAQARGQRFAVVILPTPGEAQRQQYFEMMQVCIDELARRSIPIVEVRERLDVSDYFAHHEHLNPEGARKVAEAILTYVEKASAE